MKLLFCPACADVKKIGMSLTYCTCRKSYGKYLDDINAEIGGYCIALGLNNLELVSALHNRPYKAFSPKNRFTGWVIAVPCTSVRRMKEKAVKRGRQ